ncbi:hypothetical protein RCL1_000813 [Eukaryota sp. TZLM3-RCL]
MFTLSPELHLPLRPVRYSNEQLLSFYSHSVEFPSWIEPVPEALNSTALPPFCISNPDFDPSVVCEEEKERVSKMPVKPKRPKTVERTAQRGTNKGPQRSRHTEQPPKATATLPDLQTWNPPSSEDSGILNALSWGDDPAIVATPTDTGVPTLDGSSPIADLFSSSPIQASPLPQPSQDTPVSVPAVNQIKETVKKEKLKEYVEKPTPTPTQDLPPGITLLSFEYKDPQGIIRGPYAANVMQIWYDANYLPLDLPIRINLNDTEKTRQEDKEFVSLEEWMREYKSLNVSEKVTKSSKLVDQFIKKKKVEVPPVVPTPPPSNPPVASETIIPPVESVEISSKSSLKPVKTSEITEKPSEKVFVDPAIVPVSESSEQSSDFPSLSDVKWLPITKKKRSELKGNVKMVPEPVVKEVQPQVPTPLPPSKPTPTPLEYDPFSTTPFQRDVLLGDLIEVTIPGPKTPPTVTRQKSTVDRKRPSLLDIQQEQMKIAQQQKIEQQLQASVKPVTGAKSTVPVNSFAACIPTKPVKSLREIQEEQMKLKSANKGSWAQTVTGTTPAAPPSSAWVLPTKPTTPTPLPTPSTPVATKKSEPAKPINVSSIWDFKPPTPQQPKKEEPVVQVERKQENKPISASLQAWSLQQLTALKYPKEGISDFLQFLTTLTSQNEVVDYCRQYVGVGAEVERFASEFYDRRSFELESKAVNAVRGKKKTKFTVLNLQ